MPNSCGKSATGQLYPDSQILSSSLGVIMLISVSTHTCTSQQSQLSMGKQALQRGNAFGVAFSKYLPTRRLVSKLKLIFHFELSRHHRDDGGNRQLCTPRVRFFVKPDRQAILRGYLATPFVVVSGGVFTTALFCGGQIVAGPLVIDYSVSILYRAVIESLVFSILSRIMAFAVTFGVILR